MGFDISICSFIIEGNSARKDFCDNETSLSYNWGDLSEICPQHFLESKCPNYTSCPYDCKVKCTHSSCKKIHLWYFRDDCNSRRGDDVANRAQKALDILSNYGIFPTISNPIDGECCNTFNSENISVLERIRSFAYDIKRFRDLGQQHLNCFFLGDHNSYGGTLILPDDKKINWKKKNVK
jgi:hypothetical protein